MSRRVDYRADKQAARTFGRLSGGALEIPRTPAQKIMLRAKLIRLKREAEARGRGSD